MPADNPSFFFSAVTAAYNVEPWIARFLRSLTEQTLDFHGHIQVILVDDGSTDQTGAIAEAWAREHPENTVCLRRENGGAASARNAGLDCAQGRWVTFCDADDYVDADYFARVKEFLDAGFDGACVACKLIFFEERTGEFADTHHLRFKFREESAVVDLDQRPEYVQLSFSSAFVRLKDLRAGGLRFDARVRPSFEDGHLLNKFLLCAGTRNIAFLRDARYFYRRRVQGGGLVESGWHRPEKYRDQIVYGYLDLVRFARQKTGRVPAFIQQAVIYDTQFYIEKFLLQTIPSFSPQEFADFLQLMRALFAHIDRDQVFLSPLPMLSVPIRTAMLNVFKGELPPLLPLEVEEVLADQREIWVGACTGAHAAFRFHAGRAVTPLEADIVPYEFCESLLCVSHRFRLPLGETPLSCTVDGQAVDFLHRGKIFHTFSTADLAQEP